MEAEEDAEDAEAGLSEDAQVEDVLVEDGFAEIGVVGLEAGLEVVAIFELLLFCLLLFAF